MITSNQPIKLFVDAHAFDTEYQGTQTFIRELYTCLLNNHPELDIYWGACNTARIQQNFPMVKASNLLKYKRRKSSMMRFLIDIPAYLKQHHFNYAHFQYLSPWPGGNYKTIVTTHDVLFNDFPEDFPLLYRKSRQILFGNSIKNAAIKTTVSTYSQHQIACNYHIPENQIHIIPNGVNHWVQQHELSKTAAVKSIRQKYGVANFILYVSRIEPRKNHTLLLSKYLKLGLYRQNIPLVFIGKESLQTSGFKQQIEQLTQQQRAMVHWYPQVEQADLRHFYCAARLFVYPSKAEGFGIPPLEAAVCQTPVLCSSATAMMDFDFFNPYTFNPDDEQDFEAKLQHIIANPPSAQFLANVAAQVSKKYQWQQSSQLFYNLLQTNLQS